MPPNAYAWEDNIKSLRSSLTMSDLFETEIILGRLSVSHTSLDTRYREWPQCTVNTELWSICFTVTLVFCWKRKTWRKFILKTVKNVITARCDVNATHGIAYGIFVRPSVSASRVDCDKTKQTSAHIFILYVRAIFVVFRQEKYLVTPCTWNRGLN